MGNLKGTARSKEEYLFKKKHPVRWWVSHQLTLFNRWIKKDRDLYIKKHIK